MNLTKLTKILLIFIFSFLILGCIYLGYKFLKSRNSSIPGAVRELKLSGVIKKGKDISPQKDYCLEELYLVTDTKTYQLRTPDDEIEKPSVLYAKYRNSTATVNATFQDVKPNCNELQKDCGCDQFILVKKIKELEKDKSLFKTISGVITCLPLKNGQDPTEMCALGFKADDGKYYMLKNITDDKIFEQSKLTITGEVEEVRIESLYKIDAFINVVGAK